MKSKFLLLLIFTWPVFSIAFETDQYTPYVIQKGETVSEVVHKYNLTPLYKDEEWVRAVLNLNRLNNRSTRKIKPGDIIVLPVSNKNMKDKYVLKDELKVLYSSWRSTQRLNSLKDQKSNIQLKALYRHKNVNIKDNHFNIQQTFGVNAEYWKQTSKTKNWTIAPGVLLGVFKTSDSSVSTTENISASFSPDYEFQINTRFTNKSSVSLIPALSYQSNSFIKNNNQYSISEVQTFWMKGSIEKAWFLSRYKVSTGLTLSKAISVNDFQAWETLVYSNFQMSNKFSFHADIAKTFTNTTYGEISTIGVGLGYRF